LGKGLLPLLVPLAAYHTATRKDGEKVLSLLLLSSAASALFGIFFFLQSGATFVNRARGAVGHYMTFGGQLMLLACLAIGVALLARTRKWRLGALAASLACLIALAGTFTRSAWLGLATALLVMIIAFRPRRLPILLFAMAAFYLLLPGAYRTRLHSAFEPRHPVNLERTVMWQTGIQMFLDRPWTGMGLQDLKPVYARYRDPRMHRPAGHLHSVVVQIAASMGIVGLVAFAFLYGSLFRAAGSGLASMLRSPGLAAGVRLGVLGALSGFLVAGLFEWNFGDEELLYLLYVMVGLAWSARGWERDAQGPAT
jgi:O-antigen ligase